MRFTLLASLCGLLGVVSAAPTDLSATNTTPTTTTWNPTDPLPQAANDHSSGCRTNAECLRDNMPLRKPVRRARKAAMARRSAVAAQNFYLAVHNANTNAFMGYINKSPAYNVYSYYASTSPTDYSNAATFALPGGDGVVTQQPLVLGSATNPDTSYPYWTPITSGTTHDIGPGVANVAFISQSNVEDAGGATPQTNHAKYSGSTQESSAWIIDYDTLTVSLQWINSDGSAPATYLGARTSNGYYLYMTGDIAAFNAAYASSPITPITLILVPTA